jgi:hypothetical protein
MKSRWPAVTLVAWGAVAAVAVVIVVRLIQAAAGGLAPLRAAGEIALLAGLLGVVPLAYRAVSGGTTVTWALAGLCLAAWGAGVGVPCWRMARPPRVLFDGRLGGPVREVRSEPAPRDGRYVVRATMAELERGAAPTEPVFVLHVSGADPRTLAGAEPGKPVVAEVMLTRGRPAVLFLERGFAPVQVRLAPVPLPRGLVLGGAGLALLLALLTDLVGFRAWPRGRGLLVAMVAASAIFLLLVDPDGAPTGRALLGSGGLALVGGGVVGGVVSALAGLVGRRRARRGR